MNFLDVISVIGWVAAVLQLFQFAIVILRFWLSRLRSSSKCDLERQVPVAGSFQSISDDGLEIISQRHMDPGISVANCNEITEHRMCIASSNTGHHPKPIPIKFVVPTIQEPRISETQLVAL